eukprot:Skav226320  [mRNA]  locus=scaffold3301:620869:623305:- [translate_table: standard]
MELPSLSERQKWELSPVEQLKVATYRRDLGNAEMRRGCPEKDFEEHSDEEADHPELPALEDVHAERTEEEPSIEGYAGKAKRYSQRALKLKKDDSKLWFRKGRAELLLGEISAAAASFTEAARISPKDPNVRKYLQEERKAEIEYNKRQLLYHFEKAKVKPESDCERSDRSDCERSESDCDNSQPDELNLKKVSR